MSKITPAILPALILLTALTTFAFAAEPPATTARNLNQRDSLRNSSIVFTQTKKGHVAFIGGSITEMNGYRPIVVEGLKKRFPLADFKITSAGIASTCSTTGAHRLEEDVFAHGKVDLFFIEFAVNDDQDAMHTKQAALRGMEGIIRQCRRHNPMMDIVVVHFTNEGMIATYDKGKTPVSIEAHEEVCEHYSIASVNISKEVSQLISEKNITWKIYGGTHPGPTGNALAARMCLDLCDAAWKKAGQDTSGYVSRAKPLDAGNYGQGHFVDPKEAIIDAAWGFDVPDWKNIPGSFRDTFAGRLLLHSTRPGASAAITFEGQAVGVYVLAGPDAGILEVKVDGGEWKQVNLFHRFSKGLHYPRTVMLATDLERGKHSVAIRISKDHDPASKGTAARILKFAVN
ncbi:MAG: SGNH/GDSL hydrolase family protein [Phycisphaeraceae bacterium]